MTVRDDFGLESVDQHHNPIDRAGRTVVRQCCDEAAEGDDTHSELPELSGPPDAEHRADGAREASCRDCGEALQRRG